MTRPTREEREVIGTLIAATAGEASSEQLAQVSRLVLNDDRWSTLVLEVMSQEAWLCWHASQARATGTSGLVDESSARSLPGAARLVRKSRLNSPLVSTENTNGHTNPPQAFVRNSNGVSRMVTAQACRSAFGFRMCLAAALILATGMTLGALASRWWKTGQGAIPSIADSDERGTAPADPGRVWAAYEA